MECPSRRATLKLFVLSTIYVSTVVCQNVLLEGDPRLGSQPLVMDSNREMASNSVCPKKQIMNTLYSIASGKNILPEMVPTSPGIFPEKQYAMNQNQRPNVCNVVSMSPQTSTFVPKEAISVSQPMITTTSLPQPAIPTNTMSNIIMGTSVPSPYSAPYIRPYQPNVVPTASCSAPRPPKPPQVIPLENYANVVQSYPMVFQMPQAINDFYSYNSQSPIVYAEPTLNSPTWEICPPSVVPAVNTDCGTYDIITRSYNPDIVTEPVVVMNDYEQGQGLPFNVHINVPPSNMPAPRITLVSTPPALCSTKQDPNPSYSPYSYPPPIIMRNSRSSWKKILPIILIALFRDTESYGGCCCPCPCGSDSPTPIPYPIAIPVNNPIINNAGSSKASSRRPENIPDEDDSNDN